MIATTHPCENTEYITRYYVEYEVYHYVPARKYIQIEVNGLISYVVQWYEFVFYLLAIEKAVSKFLLSIFLHCRDPPISVPVTVC